MARNLRLVWLLAVAALLSASCTSEPQESGSSEEPEIPSESPSGPSPSQPGGPPGFQALEQLPGRLALTDGTEVVLIDPTGANAEIVDSADFVAQPTWAPSGAAIAWTRREGSEASVRVLPVATTEATEDGVETPAALIDLGAAPAIYLQWSAASDQLGVLQRGAEGVALSVAPIDTGRLRPIAVGSPLYFSWALEGSALVTHVGQAVSVQPPAAAAPPPYLSGGWFTAPVWLDDETVLVAGVGALNRLNTSTGAVSPLIDLSGPTEFVVNRPRTHAAFIQAGAAVQTVQSPGTDPQNEPDRDAGPGALQVLDLESGETAMVSLSDGRAITPSAWEWSPDGSVLALLASSELRPDLVRWYFWQLAPGGGHVVGASSAFLPSEVSRRSYLPFFAQHAQSSTGWSPDGTAFAFAGTIDDVDGVFVHVPGETPQSVFVGSGDYVSWSPLNVQGGGRSIL